MKKFDAYFISNNKQMSVQTNIAAEFMFETLNNENGPAFIEYYDSGKIKQIEYWINGKLHRDYYPAKIRYYETGQIKSKEYFIMDKKTRYGKPAEILYNINGKIIKTEYYFNDVLHNELGPAIDYKFTDEKYYYLNGKQLSKVQWENIMLKKKMKYV